MQLTEYIDTVSISKSGRATQLSPLASARQQALLAYIKCQLRHCLVLDYHRRQSVQAATGLSKPQLDRALERLAADGLICLGVQGVTVYAIATEGGGA